MSSRRRGVISIHIALVPRELGHFGAAVYLGIAPEGNVLRLPWFDEHPCEQVRWQACIVTMPSISAKRWSCGRAVPQCGQGGSGARDPCTAALPLRIPSEPPSRGMPGSPKWAAPTTWPGCARRWWSRARILRLAATTAHSQPTRARESSTDRAHPRGLYGEPLRLRSPVATASPAWCAARWSLRGTLEVSAANNRQSSRRSHCSEPAEKSRGSPHRSIVGDRCDVRPDGSRLALCSHWSTSTRGESWVGQWVLRSMPSWRWQCCAWLSLVVIRRQVSSCTPIVALSSPALPIGPLSPAMASSRPWAAKATVTTRPLSNRSWSSMKIEAIFGQRFLKRNGPAAPSSTISKASAISAGATLRLAISARSTLNLNWTNQLGARDIGQIPAWISHNLRWCRWQRVSVSYSPNMRLREQFSLPGHRR